MKNSNELNIEGLSQWNNKADFWDKLHGEKGNKFHNKLVGPNVEKLLGDVKGKLILDVGCGNGVMARRLFDLGGIITAIDFSSELIKKAKAYEDYIDKINYLVLDATEEKSLLSLGEKRFDAVISTMALMDMPEIFPLFSASMKLLKSDGCFVFVTSHPSFNSNLPIMSIETEEKDGEIIVRHALKITHYLEPKVQKAMGAPNEPNPHYFYHRPLNLLLGEAFRAGLVLDALEETGFEEEDNENLKLLSWENFLNIPPVIAGRFLIR